MHLVARGVAALLLNSVASSAGFGLTQSPDSLLAQYASSNISNSTFATDVLSLLNYPNTTAQPAPSLNTTIPNISINNATLNHMFITCQGHSVLQFSCLDAINTFDAQLPRLLTVGQRVPGKRNFDLNLPVRWISGDGRCMIDLSKSPQHAVANVTGLEIRAAGLQLIKFCGSRGKGGVVTGFGPNGDLALTLNAYFPRNVQCGPARFPPFRDNCEHMSQTMEAEMQPVLRFGPAGSPDVDDGLPSAWNTRAPFGCIRTVSATDRGRDTRDMISSYNLWQVFIVIEGMCVRYGRTGRITGLGAEGKMQMDLTSLVKGNLGQGSGVEAS